MRNLQNRLSVLLHGVLMLGMLLAVLPAAGVQAGLRADAFDRDWLSYTMENSQKPQIVVDPSGGRHAVFSTMLADASSQYPVYYAYCASDCLQAENWALLKLGDMEMFGGNVTVALDPDGQPRVMWYSYSLIGRKTYHYAECNGNCGQASSWTAAAILTFYPHSEDAHYFAIDPQGSAHFIYSDDYNDPDNGTFYTSCSSDCTNPASWTKIKLDDGEVYPVDLKFTAAGSPRLVYLDASLNLIYAECNSGCDSSDNWAGIVLDSMPEGDKLLDDISFALELTSAGSPRLAYYLNDALFYAWCNTDCSASGGNWTITSPGLPKGSGLRVDLKLDDQDTPILAYQDSLGGGDDGLYYSPCIANCETASPTWDPRTVETQSDLNASDPVTTPNGCTVATWTEVGLNLSFDLDASNNPIFAYEVRSDALCNGSVRGLAHGVRYAEGGGGGGLPNSPYKTFLPMLNHK